MHPQATVILRVTKASSTCSTFFCPTISRVRVWPSRAALCANSDIITYFIDMQRRFGVYEHWEKYYHPYLYIDGYKYWTMGAPVEETIVMNRAKVNKYV